jgi:hypothetical protein
MKSEFLWAITLGCKCILAITIETPTGSINLYFEKTQQIKCRLEVAGHPEAKSVVVLMCLSRLIESL